MFKVVTNISDDQLFVIFNQQSLLTSHVHAWIELIKNASMFPFLAILVVNKIARVKIDDI